MVAPCGQQDVIKDLSMMNKTDNERTGLGFLCQIKNFELTRKHVMKKSTKWINIST